MNRRKLFVNVDHVATVRQARLGKAPDPVFAASLAEMAGADGIIVHLREDRRHIQDRDLETLKDTVQTEIHLEMAGVAAMVKRAISVKPEVCVLVPERRQELTTEGGLDVAGHRRRVADTVKRLNSAGLPVSLFIDPESKQIDAARNVGAKMIEIHTGEYCNARRASRSSEFKRIQRAARGGVERGLVVASGHGLDYVNIVPLLDIPEITEFNIGFSIVARAVLAGFERAVADMCSLVHGRR